MTVNLFDYFERASVEQTPDDGRASACWAARAPRRPHREFDVKLVPRSHRWQEDSAALAMLAQIEREPWVDTVARGDEGVRVRVRDSWIEARGAALEAGAGDEATLADLAHGRRYAVQFWDPNATKALHVGHLRNLAIGNALSAALAQAGGQVERRSLISDAGRSMGEAMAGVLSSGRHTGAWADGGEKSDHFVGVCYADYVTAGGAGGRVNGGGQSAGQQTEDSLTRELTVQGDEADELLQRVLRGERDTLELWYKTRAWVISGQRKTLARLGIAFDRVFFESDFLAEAAELTESGLREGRLRRREDGVVVYATGMREYAELPLVRADGLPTQNMRAVAYWMAAPELEHMTSMQICGTEWVSNFAGAHKLMDELTPAGNGGVHPRHNIFNGMVSRQKRALASSEGALLIDELTDWLDQRIDADPARHEVRCGHPAPERIAAQVALGYFLPHPVAPRMDFDPEKLLLGRESMGWDLARARARDARRASSRTGRPVEDPDYRFAVVQSELYRRYLRLAVARLDVRPLAHYLRHLAIWHLERERGEHVERVMHTLLDRSARGLGLEAIR